MNNRFKALLLFMFITQTYAENSIGILEVYKLALKHDAQLAQAQAVYQASMEGLDIAKAPLLPQLSASGSYTIDDGTNGGNVGVNAGGNANNIADVSTLSAGVNLRQSLYEKDVWDKYEKAKIVLDKSKYEFKIAEQEMIIRLAKSYFKVLLAQVDLKLEQAQVTANKTQWQRSLESKKVGLVNIADVLQAKSNYDLSKSEKIAAENNLDIANEELITLVGVKINNIKTMKFDVRITHKKLDIHQYEDLAVNNNITVLKLTEQKNIADKEVAIQKSGHWPKLYLQGSYVDQSYSNFDSRFAVNYRARSNLKIGIYAQLPIYAGGGISASVSQAIYSAKATNIGVRAAKENAKLNARVEVKNLQRGYKLIAANRVAVQSNEAFVVSAEESYLVGLTDQLSVLTARANKYQALRNLTLSLHNFVLSDLRLAKATGSLSINDLIKIETILSAQKFNG